MTGKTIAHFEILDVLGEGGMGVVYVARDLRLGRRVALKFLPPDLETDEGARDRLIQEARAASALNHPNICTIHEIGESDRGAVYIAMALYEGETLKERLARGPLSAPATVDVARQTARGLAAAHRADIVHRDIKPANLFVTDDEQVRILDFGLAKVAKTHLTRTGSTLGTVHYMSPEQARGDDVDHRTDIWALGCVMYEMLTGRNPFDAEHDAAVAYRLMNDAPEPLGSVLPPAYAGLEAVVGRCLQKEREARYPSAAEIERALAALADRHSPAPKRPRSALWIGLGAMLLALLGYLGYRSVTAEPVPTGAIAVLPFTATGMDSLECVALSDIVSQELADAVRNGASAYWVIPQRELRDRDIRTGTSAHRDMGANLAVEGFCFAQGGTVDLDVSIVNAATMRQTADARVGASQEDLRGLQHDAARAIARLLPGWSSAGASDEPAPGGTDLPAAFTHFVRGTAHLMRSDARDDLDQAIVEFRQATLLDPDFGRALTRLGEALLYRYRFHDADERWIDEAVDQATSAIAAAPASAEARIILAEILRERGDLDGAHEAFDAAMAIDSTDWQVIRLQAVLQRSAGQPEAADRSYRRAVRLAPDYWPLRFEYGEFLFTNDRLDEAGRQFREIERLVPESFLAANAMGGLFLRLGDYDRAVTQFERASRIRENARSVANLASILFYVGRYGEAAAAYRHATELPDGARDYQIWGNLGLAEKAAGRTSEAMSAFGVAIGMAESARQARPEDAEVAIDLATYNLQIGQRERAVEFAEQALESARDGHTWHSAAVVFERSGQRERALYWIGQALENGYPVEFITGDPDLEDLRSDPRFRELVRGDAPDRLPDLDS